TSDTLVRARFQAGGASHAVELLASARPVVSAAATETVSGSVVTIADHGFTLRFGDAAREVFRALLWDQPPDALASVLAAHCPSVRAAGCTGNCMVDACTKGAAVLPARPGRAVRRRDAPPIDVRPAGGAGAPVASA